VKARLTQAAQAAQQEPGERFFTSLLVSVCYLLSESRVLQPRGIVCFSSLHCLRTISALSEPGTWLLQNVATTSGSRDGNSRQISVPKLLHRRARDECLCLGRRGAAIPTGFRWKVEQGGNRVIRISVQVGADRKTLNPRSQ
jgi:hypothetical protein